jgi:hypothetical protein
MTLIDAVDGLQQTAVDHGLVDAHGQDWVQWIMSRAFGSIAWSS